MKIIFYDVAPCCLVCEYTDVSEQPAEEVHPDDEDYSYLLNVCVKVKNGMWSAGKWREVKGREVEWIGVKWSEVKRSEAKWWNWVNVCVIIDLKLCNCM